jgi:hypothetical protein
MCPRLNPGAVGDNTADDNKVVCNDLVRRRSVEVEEARPAAVVCNDLVGICSRSTRRGSVASY